MKEPIHYVLEKGERRNIEFKSALGDEHLLKDRRERLSAQMKYRLKTGGGKAYYILGVSDDGKVVCQSEEEFEKTLEVIKKLAESIGAKIVEVERYHENGIFGRVTIEESRSDRGMKEHITIGTIGHVDHGKSTLIGTLLTGMEDDGVGKTRIFLDFLPHEIERGLTAEITHTVFGFKGNDRIYLKNPLNKKEVADLIDRSDKIVSFVDCPGHEPWLRTTVRGILGQRVDYVLLIVAADDGVTPITKEHLGIALAMEIPLIIVITKVDKVSYEEAKKVIADVSSLLRRVGKVPLNVKDKETAKNVSKKVSERFLIPIIKASSITLEGIDILNELFLNLPEKTSEELYKRPFLMYIDKVYKVKGAGTVISGRVKEGVVKKGQELLLGPINDRYETVSCQSIKQHHLVQNRGEVGDILGIAIKGVDADQIKRGMVLKDENGEVKSVREFLAEIFILNHPTRIKEGYEPIIHLETISETVTFEKIYNQEYLSTGDRALIKMKFKYNSYYLTEGDKFIFREAKSKGIGGIKKIL
ncbi:MAG: Elongation factor 1-alpha [Candidatus Methanofastidiosum methylothiophilum]|uniref:Elongation factor 1-alpha n=1 Tax=Candidatus Methanofastidiosum methylothiophilum TaxID=1705564 RepID=A0A150IXH0_9EURY|nr:MAG: Elongation factor 1-alpha [Candidatus Methanofastidiosum methylthiophilus]NMC76820.1 GTP-binding protein [Candidatus Methanofastidiosa archaeon]